MLNAISSRQCRGWDSKVVLSALFAWGLTVGCGGSQARHPSVPGAAAPAAPVAGLAPVAAPLQPPVLVARRAAATRPSIDETPSLAKQDETAFDGPRYASANEAGFADDSGIPHRVVRAALRPRQRQLRGCYDDVRVDNPRLSGKLVVAWTVDRSGAVLQPAVVTRTLESPALEACVVRELSRVSFPRSHGSSRVEYPFVFRPN